jgi:hypothetical protein
LQRYIEAQLAARLGKQVDEGQQRLSRQQQEELELYRLPEGLQVRCNMLYSMSDVLQQVEAVLGGQVGTVKWAYVAAAAAAAGRGFALHVLPCWQGTVS